jgi:hypothetical protein
MRILKAKIDDFLKILNFLSLFLILFKESQEQIEY